MTFSLPTSGTDPKVATRADLETQIDIAISEAEGPGFRNAWHDPFFRSVEIGVDHLHRKRWHDDVTAEWSMVENDFFEGRALRRADGGVGTLSGLVIWFDEIGAVTGDIVTIRALMIGTGVSVGVTGRPMALSGVETGSGSPTTTVVSSSVPQVIEIQHTIGSGHFGYVFYPFVALSGVGSFDILSLWAFKGTAGPKRRAATQPDIFPIQKALARDFEIRCMPPKIFTLQNMETNIYYDNLIGGRAADYLWRPKNLSRGEALDDCWRMSLSTGLVSGAAQIDMVHPFTNKVVGELPFLFVMTSAADAATKTIVYNRIGDSITARGDITSAIVARATEYSTTLSCIGTQGTSPALHEGYTGRTVDWFATDAASPIVFGGVVNYPQYLSSNGFATPTHVGIQLGTNDIFTIVFDSSDFALENALTATENLAASEFAKLDTIIASIHSVNSTIIVGIVPVPMPSEDQSAFGNSYGISHLQFTKEKMVATWNRALIARYGGREDERIEIPPSTVAWDTKNSASKGVAQPVNARVPFTVVAEYTTQIADLTPGVGEIFYCTDIANYIVKVGPTTKGFYRAADERDGIIEPLDDGVHPPEPGGGQIGDAEFAWLVASA
jgi:hypothetical protein